MPRPAADVPPCYALVHPGLEAVAADEITRDLGGTVRRAEHGLVVFRVPAITPELLTLRTTEDVFLLAWGSDALTLRPTADLPNIRKWTAKEADWPRLLQLHHGVRPKPKGKPTYHFVTQMSGEHGYRRTDAREAMIGGLEGVFPESWREADEDASVEVWLTIQSRQAVCGLRLSDRTMRHRDHYKLEHLPASLRPSLAAAMVRLAGAAPGDVVLDPMCGAGTILAEQIELARRRKAGRVDVIGGDLDANAVRSSGVNLRRVGPFQLARWDAGRLPLPTQSIDRIVCNLPFGKQIGVPEEMPGLYRWVVQEWDRVLKPDGRAVLLVGDAELLGTPARLKGWKSVQTARVRVLGQMAALTVWRKPAAAVTLTE